MHLAAVVVALIALALHCVTAFVPSFAAPCALHYRSAASSAERQDLLRASIRVGCAPRREGDQARRGANHALQALSAEVPSPMVRPHSSHCFFLSPPSLRNYEVERLCLRPALTHAGAPPRRRRRRFRTPGASSAYQNTMDLSMSSRSNQVKIPGLTVPQPSGR